MKIKLNIPQSWNELNEHQLASVCVLMHTESNPVAFNVKCFKILVPVTWWNIWARIKRLFVLCNVPMSELKQSFNYLIENTNRTVFPKIKPIKGVQYYPPFPQLANISIDELAIADDLHIKWRTSKNVEYLYYLAAVLYTSNQQPRPVFDKNDLKLKHEVFKRVPLGELLAIEIAFFGSMEYISQRYKNVFPKSNKAIGNSQKSIVKSSGFPKLIRSLAGGKFGDLQSTKRTNCYDFLSEFEDLLIQQKNAK